MDGPSFYKRNTLPELGPSEDIPPLPEKIGPYRIESLLNKGGMSLLYLGIDPQSKKPLAIKVLSPSYVTHPEAIEHFLKEAKVIALSNHPNIVKLYGQGEWEGGLYMAMELIRGISLRQFIMRQSLSMRRALEIVLQVAYALSHLHSHGVIHRDLKPENILITEEGEIKVIDFGIAQLHEENYGTPPQKNWAGYLGTPSYMSPEQKENPSAVTPATDIYALGVILYELILGKLSYGTIHLSALPKKLKKIAAKALAVSLEKRYQNISECIHDISLYLDSGELNKERTGKDLIIEFNETIQKAHALLSPAAPPSWPQIDSGIAKPAAGNPLGLYYDFFRFSDNTFLLFIAVTETSTVESSLSIATLRGMIRMRLQERNASQSFPFKLIPFIHQLNESLCEDPLRPSFAFGCVLLDPLNDLVTYLSCSLSPLIHIPQGETKSRALLSSNDLLGLHAGAAFSETSDSWNPGDSLLFHSLVPAASPEAMRAFEQSVSEAVQESLLFSAQRQAEAALKKLTLSPCLPYPKLLLSLQRIF